MDVELYVYDLSGGMARQYSVALTGVYIDAIYHTAVVLGGVEYFFGQGIHRKIPGSTHHGRPMEIIRMGHTDLPLELIQEYIQSLESIYTPESYDLFVHNCNNFSQDLCMFLVGKSIPQKISNLPETFLKTPIGQMMRGQIDQSMRRMTQAPDAVSGQNVMPTSGHQATQSVTNGVNSQRPTFINSLPKVQQPRKKARHPHAALKLPLLEKRITTPTLATTSPPLDKLLARISSALGQDIQLLKSLADHVKLREAKGSADAPLPDMQGICEWITNNFDTSGDAQFAIVDLLRIAAVDPRISAFLVTDDLMVLKKVFNNENSWDTPYNLKFTRLQLGLNLFSSAMAQETIVSHEDKNKLAPLLGNLIVSCLLEDNFKLRLQAASLLTNLAAIDHNQRLDSQDDMVNLNTITDGGIESALVQAIVEETESKDTLTRLIYALGLLLYRVPEEHTSSMWELCQAMELIDVLKGREIVAKETVTLEVLKLLEAS